MEFLKRLTETPGVPGREERIRQVIEKEKKFLEKTQKKIDDIFKECGIDI